MRWSSVDEVALQGKTGEYVVPGPTKKGMPKKRRKKGLEPAPKSSPQPSTSGPRKIRDYPEFADMLDIKPVNVMGLKTPSTKLRIPYSNVTKNRRFIKGVDWALENLAVKPAQELAKQERNAEANLKKLKGADLRAVVRLNKMFPMRRARITSPLHFVLSKMRDIAVRKGGGGNARALKQSGDPFWYGVMRLGEVLSEVAPWDAMDAWVAQEIAKMFQKYAGLELNLDTGKIRLPWAKPKMTEVRNPINEAKKDPPMADGAPELLGASLGKKGMAEECETHHGKDGKFCARHRAKTVTKDGVRYKPVTQLRRIKGGKTRSKRAAPKEEVVVNAVDHDRDLSNLRRWRRIAELNLVALNSDV